MTTDARRAPIPMLDLAAQTAELGTEIEKAITAVVQSSRFVLGPQLEAFERESAEALGVAHAIGVGSGTDALILALRALGVGPGDEVVTPAFSFVATAEAIVLCGATPVFADIDPQSFCLCPRSAAAKIGPRTRALLPVHLYGHPADMDALGALARERGLEIVEDAAQAFGARNGERRVGGIGALGAFSFFPSKNLGAFGDGGLVTTQSDAAAERVRLLRNHGQRDRYQHVEVGWNSRLDELQAAVLRVKLPHVERWNEARRRIAAAYCEALADVDEIELPAAAVHGSHVYQVFTLRVRGDRRDALQAALGTRGVTSVVYYPEPLHRSPLYGGGESSPALPEAERAAQQVLSLPIWPELDPQLAHEIGRELREALAGL